MAELNFNSGSLNPSILYIVFIKFIIVPFLLPPPPPPAAGPHIKMGNEGGKQLEIILLKEYNFSHIFLIAL